MKWSAPRVPDIKGVVDKFHLYDRILQRNVSLIQGFGTPCTYWRNKAISPIGVSPNPATSTKCYCWSTPVDGGGSTTGQTVQPQRDHFLCSGTGWLDVEGGGGGYQKYGYREHIFSTPSVLTANSKDVIVSGTRNSSYIVSGSSASGTLTTERITLNKFKDFNYLLVNDEFDAAANRVDYSYSLNDTTWIPLTLTNTTGITKNIGNRQATISLPVGTSYIRFRITLLKRVATAPSPKWNSLRFRYRNTLTLAEIDPRFEDIQIPAFLASREQIAQQVEGSAQNMGWITRFPLKWKTLPDTDIESSDVIRFLKGTFVGLNFEVHDLLKFTYGESTQILHRGFESVLVRDGNDVLKIAAYLL